MLKFLKNNRGFSLVELAIGLSIVSLMAGTALEAYKQYKATPAPRISQQRRAIVVTALAKFVSDNGRFPCPADPSMSLDTPYAGKENCPNGPSPPSGWSGPPNHPPGA